LSDHKDPKTTRHYTKIADDVKRAAVDAMRGTDGNADDFTFQSPTVQSRHPGLRRVK